MLHRLYIRNIALIRKVELIFENGMISVTGETGAGKSMLVDSCALALGGRADASLLRHNCEDAVVEATFKLVENNKILSMLNDLAIPVDDNELIMRRFLNNKGKTKGFINGVRVNQSQMKEIGGMIVDIHSQHDNQLLLKPHYHLGLLDNFGELNSITASVKKKYLEWEKCRNLVNKTKNNIENQEEEELFLKSYIKELKELDPQKNEITLLEEERKKLMAGEQLIEIFSSASKSLNGSAGVSAVDMVAAADKSFASIGDVAGDDITEISSRLSSVYEELNDITSEIEILGNGFELSPDRLEHVNDRLFDLKSCAKKHNITTDELISLMDNLLYKLSEISIGNQSLEELEKKAEKLLEVYTKQAEKLTVKRKEVAINLAAIIAKSLAKLKMSGTKFKVDFSTLKNGNSKGLEEAEFTISTNNSEKFSPLAKVASGGEVSRLMLSLKEIFYDKKEPTTLIFDEVDTGVGGAVADAVGGTLQDMASKHQVFVITHLPQVAARGGSHIKIEKSADTKNGEIVTSVKILNKQQREEEIARMLAGSHVTPEARSAAVKLLGS